MIVCRALAPAVPRYDRPDARHVCAASAAPEAEAPRGRSYELGGGGFGPRPDLRRRQEPA